MCTQFQLDPIKVVVRAHTAGVPRGSAGTRERIDRLAYEKRELFEYVGHAASLLDVRLHPLMRWRMHEWATQTKWKFGYLEEGTTEVRERGPLTPNDLTFQQRFRWPDGWNFSYGKQTLAQLMRMGVVTVAGRRGSKQVYDLTSAPAAAPMTARHPRRRCKQELNLAAGHSASHRKDRASTSC